MFDFLLDIGNYEQRKVARFEDGDLCIDTAAVSDGEHPIETAISHPEYNHGKWVVVEGYDSKEQALVGHERWIQKMTAMPLPIGLTDCRNSHISKICENLTFLREVI